jgi:hypothetical protein
MHPGDQTESTPAGTGNLEMTWALNAKPTDAYVLFAGATPEMGKLAGFYLPASSTASTPRQRCWSATSAGSWWKRATRATPWWARFRTRPRRRTATRQLSARTRARARCCTRREPQRTEHDVLVQGASGRDGHNHDRCADKSGGANEISARTLLLLRKDPPSARRDRRQQAVSRLRQ